MHLLEITPSPCILCGRGNTPDSHGDPVKFVDLERDVNWNDPAILCEFCALRIGGIIGMLSPDTISEVKQQLRDKERELHEQKAAMDQMKARARKLGMEFQTVTS